MEIKEAIKRKRQLRENLFSTITTLTKNFEEETGLTVNGVHLSYEEISEIGFEPKNVLHSVNIDLEL